MPELLVYTLLFAHMHAPKATQKTLSTPIDLPTIEPDLPVTTGERTNISHVYYRPSEALEEGTLVKAKAVDDGNCCGASCGVQLLIGQKKPFIFLEVGVEVVVKQVWGCRVEVREDTTVAILRAKFPEIGQVPRVYGGIRATVRGEVVEPRVE